MKDATYQRRLEEAARIRGLCLGRKKGDYVNHQSSIDKMREPMPILIYMMEGHDFDSDYPHYQATRYYSLSVNPEDFEESVLADISVYRKMTITRWDFEKYWGAVSHGEQNKYLEELWIKDGGE